MEIAHANITIQLRATQFDRDLIDQAAQALGINRTQFMLNAAIREAKEALLDQTTIYVNSKAFTALLDQLDNPTPPSDRLIKTLTAPSRWEHE